jgi:hypothetical protein
MSEIQVSRINEEMPSEQPSFLKRILWVFTSPGKLMASLAEKPRVLFALILSAISMDALYLLRMPLYTDMLRTQALAQAGLTKSLSGQVITPAMIEQTLPMNAKLGIIAAPFTMLFMWLFITLVFFAILKIMGGEGKFKAYMSVTGYAYVISSAYILLILIVSFFTGSLLVNPSLTSLATLVSPDSVGTVVYSLLKGMDIFSIWYYVVIAIGLAVVSKLKKRNVYIAVGVVFLIGLIISVAGASVMQSLV